MTKENSEVPKSKGFSYSFTEGENPNVIIKKITEGNTVFNMRQTDNEKGVLEYIKNLFKK